MKICRCSLKPDHASGELVHDSQQQMNFVNDDVIKRNVQQKSSTVVITNWSNGTGAVVAAMAVDSFTIAPSPAP